MIKKLLVLGVILAAGGFFAYSQFGFSIDKYLPVNAVAQDLGGLKNSTVDRVSYEFDKTVDSFGNKIDQIKPSADEINPIKKISDVISVPKDKIYYGQVYEKDEQDQSCKISVPALAKTVNGITELTHTISLNDCKFEEHQPVQVTQIYGTSNTHLPAAQTGSASTQPQAITVTPVPKVQIFETLQLKTVRNTDDTVSIQYDDTSGKTLKVTVNLRNSERQLFSGEFFASKFDANVNDVSDSPHIVEMIVDHAEYGTVYSSVFNPQGSEETTISGVFTQQ